MTDTSTLRISARMAEEIQQWASDELGMSPRDTAYAADLENLLAQLTAEQPAPDAVAEADAERVAAALWREEAAEGTPKSVMERRTPESFRSMLNPADQDRWMRKGRAAVAALAKGPYA